MNWSAASALWVIFDALAQARRKNIVVVESVLYEMAPLKSSALQILFVALTACALGVLHIVLFSDVIESYRSTAPPNLSAQRSVPVNCERVVVKDDEPPVPALEKRASVAYSILTTSAFHNTRLKKVMETWGRHANIAFITTDRVDPSYPKAVVLGDGERDLGGKTLQAFEKFCSVDADFFVLIDDDGFVVTYNLEHNLTNSFHRDEPLYAGYTLTHTSAPFVGGGGGIVLSNATLRRYCRVVQESKQHSPCRWQVSKSLPGDVAVSSCMKSLGVAATHIDGFSPFPMSQMVDNTPNGWCKITWWLPKHLKCNPPYEKTMTMHYVPLDEYDELYLLTYQLYAKSKGTRHS